MTLGEIIKQYRQEHSMSMEAFSRRSGISKAYISLLEKNKHPRTGKPIAPSVQSIKQAADGMRMDFNDLFPLIDGEVTLPKDDPLPDYDNIQPIEVKRYPVLGEIACGEPLLMQDTMEVYVESTTNINADFILMAKGDSMTGARIYDGDIVFVRKQDIVDNGEIAVVAIDDEATLKRFYKYDGLVLLQAENPNYKDIEIREEDGKMVRVLGKAVAFQSDIR